MDSQETKGCSRRAFMGGLALAGAAAALGVRPEPAAAAIEPPPETTRLRIQRGDPACWAPMYVAEPLLRKEGFTDIEYVFSYGTEVGRMARAGAIDLSPGFSASAMYNLEQQQHPLKILSGLHVGCYFLVGSDRVRSVRDLKGKTVWAGAVKNEGPHLFFMAIVSYVGLDPNADFTYLWVNKNEAMRLFREGKIDAFISFPPGPQELIAQGYGHVMVDTNIDKPWSQYFCCIVSGQSYFIEKNPIATRRALRAILRAVDIVARDPVLAAKTLVAMKIRPQAEYETLVRVLKEIPYGRWREYNPEETVRFYALRMRETGMIATAPQEFIDRHTDWRFINGLKKESGITAW